MAENTYTKMFEQIYERTQEQFFEEIFNSSYSEEYVHLFENIYQEHLRECTAYTLYDLIRTFKDELSDPKKKNQTINVIVNQILSDGNEIFEINEKASVSGKPKLCIFLDELDQIYWKDKGSIFNSEFLSDILYNVFIELKKRGAGISESTLKNAVVGKYKKNFWDAHNGNYENALKHFINDFIENNSRADFSHVDDKVRTEYSEKFKKELERG